MVKSICVRAPSLPRLATVLVLQRAVNRQPGSRAWTRRAGEFSLTFLFKNSKISIFQKFPKNNTLVKNFMRIELWACISVLGSNYLHPKPQYLTQTSSKTHKHTLRSIYNQKHDFHGQVHLRAGAQSAPLSSVLVLQRAINRQPGYCSENSKGTSASSL